MEAFRGAPKAALAGQYEQQECLWQLGAAFIGFGRAEAYSKHAEHLSACGFVQRDVCMIIYKLL